ncbi:hypothetical protein [Cribrihabitans neustonicus]|uniref:hypothetical protein n=1 Tax=Cribrihabitans neustonicus TaxID=1429085 RepID=UPI003B59EEB5
MGLLAANTEAHGIPGLLLGDGEQVVLAVPARTLPTLNEMALILLFAPAALILYFLIHRTFRRVAYVITTKRVLVLEPEGTAREIAIADIRRTRTLRGAMMVHGAGGAVLWLPRLRDGWQFDTVLTRVRQLQ